MFIPSVERQEADEGSSIPEAFPRHLVGQPNLVPSMVRPYLDAVGRFLDWRFGTQSLQFGALCAKDVIIFMLEQVHRYRAWTHPQPIASALRGFLRFLFQTGAMTRDLAQYMPTLARRHLSRLPKFMLAEDVERLLQSVDQQRPQGPRDHAIVLLLARLGLRICLIAS